MIPGMLFTVYSLTNVKTGRNYYGRTKDFRKRKLDHIKQISNGSHYNQEMVADHMAGNDEWEFKILYEDLTQLQANVISDQLAKHDIHSYNILGIVGNTNTGRKKLNREMVEQIRELYFEGDHNQMELSKIFNVSQGHISLVVNGLIHNDGEFVPPKQVPEEYEVGREHREALRARFAELKKQLNSLHKALTVLTREFKLSKRCIQFWVHNDPDKISSNQNHRPSDYHVLIDGVKYKTKTAFSQQTGVPLHELVKIGPRSFKNMNNTVIIDGVPVKINGKRTNASLKEHGYALAVKMSTGVFVTKESKETKKHPEVTRRLKEISRARKALLDPVLAANGRVLLKPTAEKHNCSVYYLKILLDEALQHSSTEASSQNEPHRS